MEIKPKSWWVDDRSGKEVLVKKLIGESFREVMVHYDVLYSSGEILSSEKCSYREFLYCNSPKTYSTEDAYEDGFKKGKDFNKDDQNLNYRTGYNDGWHDCEASFELGNEFTDSIQEQSFDEGYDQAIDDLIEAGVIGEEEYLDEDCSEECYSEYEFGDVEDDEEEYCFSKELERVLNGESASNIKSDKKTGEDLEEYKQGYEDGKSRGITLGYNKRDYEYSKPNNSDEDCSDEEYCFFKELERVLDSELASNTKSEDVERKHSHYFKDVRHLDYVDVYQVCKLFPVDDDSGAIIHARKKLLVAGGRGAGKDMIKDITEARDTLNRYLQIEGIEE